MAESEQKPTRSLTERKIKALEEYLGLVFKAGDDYDDYVVDEYGVIPNLKEDVKKLKEKAFPNEKKKPHFWN